MGKRPARDPYDVLGVSKDASSEDIKREYRRKAHRAHPDKASGSHDEMAELASAFRVVGDPERRKLYDATGQTEASDEDEIIRNTLIEAFTKALMAEAAQVLVHARGTLTKAIDAIDEQCAAGAVVRANLQKKRSQIRLKPKRGRKKQPTEVNLFHALIDKELEGIARGLAELKERRRLLEKALATLDAYESDEAAPEMMRRITLTGVFGTTSTIEY